MKEISANNIRWKLTEVLNEACFKNSRFFITKNKKPMAVLLGIEDYQELMGKLGEPHDVLKSFETEEGVAAPHDIVQRKGRTKSAARG